ncbi:chromosome replication initiation inhibitor protein [compost metagenome]
MLNELARGELVELIAERPVDVPLYWHHWRNGGELLERLTGHLRKAASECLVPPGQAS